MLSNSTRLLITAAGVASLGFAATAVAQAPIGPLPKFGPAAQRVEAQGFTILEMDRDRGGFDIEAIASDGRHLELDVNAKGNITRQRMND